MFAQEAKQEDQCFTCHEMLGSKEAELFKNDVHHLKGLSCAACQGGDSKNDDMDAAMNPKIGFTGVPKGDGMTEKCIKCHADQNKMKSYGSNLPTNQYENLKSSVHWKLSLSGREHIVQCTTCHNAHGIISVKNNLSPVHPLNVPKTCSSCHSNEVFMRAFNPSLPVDQLQKYKLASTEF